MKMLIIANVSRCTICRFTVSNYT